MSTTSSASRAPVLVAVLVVTDGEAWLPGVLRTLSRQDTELVVVAVDNASEDNTPTLLAEALPDDQRVRLSQRVGFGRAVATAIADTVAKSADRLLLVHDDLLLAPDAARRLSEALDAEPDLGLVGCKLRAWSHEPVLAELGQTVDALGRLEPTIEPGEVDQGQRDHQREALAVSTAGMMVRRRLFADVGGFDSRFPLFRDDLDLCWRARVAGWRVGVVADAVGYHLGAASGGARDLGRPARARELAERHAVAAMLKNYRLWRLLWVLPVVVAVAVAKMGAFVVARRFGDAGAVGRALVWNLVQLPLTLRRRRRVQSRRRVSDAQVTAWFAPGLPRLRTYGEAVGSWLAGGTTRALPDEERRETRIDDVAGWPAWRRRLAERPALPVAAALLVVYLVGVAGLLGPGAIRGGSVDPWPASVSAFFAAAFAPLESAPLATGTVGSPAPVVLGVLSLLGLGDDWAASRLLLLGALPLAWVAALHAGRALTDRQGPRVLGATLYALSPAVLGAVAAGAVDVLAAAAVIPALLAAARRLRDPVDDDRAAAWRHGATTALCVTVLGALAPAALPVAAVVVVAVALSPAGDGRRLPGLRRLAPAVVAGLVPLVPWLVGLAMAGWAQAVPGAATEPMTWWQALAAIPAEAPLGAGITGVVAASTAGAVALGALWMGFVRRPLVVAGLALVAVAAGGAAWLLARVAPGSVSPGALVVLAALAHSGLAVLAARWATDRLSAHAFGLRQLGLVALAVVVVVGLAGGVVRLGSGTTDGLTRDVDPLPAFVRGDTGQVGPYRVLLLDAAADGGMRWEMVEADGPSMTRYGATPDAGLVANVDAAVTALAGGADPRGGGLLGAANVRYLVAGELPGEIAAAIDRQPDLEPVPSGDAQVWQVRSWLPRVVVRPPGAAEAARGGDPGEAGDAAEDGLLRVGAGRWVGDRVPDAGGALLVAEADGGRWSAVGDGEALEPVDAAVGSAFTVPGGTGEVAARYDTPLTGRLAPALTLALLVGCGWVLVRPPGSARRRRGAAHPVAPPPPPDVTAVVHVPARPADDHAGPPDESEGAEEDDTVHEVGGAGDAGDADAPPSADHDPDTTAWPVR